MEPKLTVKFYVSAYDESGYGDNRSKDFDSGDAAVAYAESLEARFHASVYKRITMEPMSIQIWPIREP
jgi:hypothetical protein